MLSQEIEQYGITVILIAASADPEIFKNLLYGKQSLQENYEKPDVSRKICDGFVCSKQQG